MMADDEVRYKLSYSPSLPDDIVWVMYPSPAEMTRIVNRAIAECRDPLRVLADHIVVTKANVRKS